MNVEFSVKKWPLFEHEVHAMLIIGFLPQRAGVPFFSSHQGNVKTHFRQGAAGAFDTLGGAEIVYYRNNDSFQFCFVTGSRLRQGEIINYP